MSNLDLIRDGRHYDALKAQNDIPFYLSQAQVRGPVLEIGCGTGRVTIPLAAAGVETTGVDVSASMLEAKRKAQEQEATVRWVEADARHFDLGRRFAAILMPFNTLQFFRDKPSLTQVFDRVKCHLAKGGRFIFDVFNPQVSFLAADPEQRYERARYPDPYGRGEVVLEVSRECLVDRQIIRSTRYYHIGEQPDVASSSLELRCFFPCELDLVLEHHGFRLDGKYGDFDGTPFGKSSPKQICVCSVHRSEDHAG